MPILLIRRRLGPQIELHETLRRGPFDQRKIDLLHFAGAQLHEPRVLASGVANTGVADFELQRLRHRGGVQLHHVRARRYILEVKTSAGIGNRVATIFQVNADVGLASARRQPAIAATTLDAAEDESAPRKEVLAQGHTGARDVRQHVARRMCLGGVDQFTRTRRRHDIDNIAHRRRLAGRDQRNIETQRTAVGSAYRVGSRLVVHAHRCAAQAHALRQLIVDGHVARGRARITIGHTQLEFNRVTQCRRRQVDGLGQ